MATNLEQENREMMAWTRHLEDINQSNERRIAELEAENERWTLECRDLHRTIAKLHEEYRPDVQATETLNRIAQLSKERASPQWLREEIRKWEGEE